MKWVLQNNMFSEPFYAKMLDYLERMGIEYETTKGVPFTGDMDPEPTINGPAIAIGSYSFTNRAIAKGWKPGSWTNENYDYRVWAEKWKGMVLNEPAIVCEFKDVPYTEDVFFMRPCADDKIFTGAVYTYKEYADWKAKLDALVRDTTTIDLHPHTPVVVGAAFNITSEYRFVIVNKQVVTGSLYKNNGVAMYKEVQPIETELLDFVKKVVDVWVPSDVFCLDIALCGGDYHVLEMGNFNSAGLYDCDVQKIVMAIEDFVAMTNGE